MWGDVHTLLVYVSWYKHLRRLSLRGYTILSYVSQSRGYIIVTYQSLLRGYIIVTYQSFSRGYILVTYL